MNGDEPPLPALPARARWRHWLPNGTPPGLAPVRGVAVRGLAASWQERLCLGVVAAAGRAETLSASLVLSRAAARSSRTLLALDSSALAHF